MYSLYSLFKEKESKNEIIKMVSKENNEHYICEIPKVKKEKDKVIRRSNVSNVKNALALLEPLKNKCLYHVIFIFIYKIYI